MSNRRPPGPDQALLDEYYPDGAPIIIQVAFDQGYGPAIVELNKKVYELTAFRVGEREPIGRIS